MLLTARDFGVKTNGASYNRFNGIKSQSSRYALHFISNAG